MTPRLFLTALCALALVACQKKADTDTPAAPEAPVLTEGVSQTDAPTPPDTPSSDEVSQRVTETDTEYVSLSEDYELKASVSPAIASFDADLATALMTTARGELESFRASSADLREGKTIPFAMEINVFESAQAGDLISVRTDTYADAGGAHPNHWSVAELYRRGVAASVPVASLFTNTDALKAVVIEELVKEKIARGYGEPERDMIRGELNDALADEQSWLKDVALVASDTDGKFGGVQVLFSPYDIGAYAEGGYAPVVPASALGDMLKPEAKDLFGGQPASLPEE